LVKSQLAKSGVEAKINLMDLTAVIDRFVVKHDFDMCVSSFADLLDINMRSVSFFKDGQANYLGMDDPQLEALVHQWRRSLEPAKRLAISADIQRLLAEQMYWINVAGYPFFRAHTGKVKGFPFYGQAYLFLESTWLDK
jgi:ABC-type transport system substrate-binding protein